MSGPVNSPRMMDDSLCYARNVCYLEDTLERICRRLGIDFLATRRECIQELQGLPQLIHEAASVVDWLKRQ